MFGYMIKFKGKIQKGLKRKTKDIDRTILFILTLIIIFGVLSLFWWNNNIKYMTRNADFLNEIRFLRSVKEGNINAFINPFDNTMKISLGILIPIYSLFSLIFPSNILIFFLGGATIASGALPLYLISKSKLNRMNSLLISILYLVHPIVISLTFGFIQIGEIIFIPLFLWCWYFYETGSFKKYLIFIIMTGFVKITVSPILFVFGLYLLTKEVDNKYALVPILISITIVSFFILNNSLNLLSQSNSMARIFGINFGFKLKNTQNFSSYNIIRNVFVYNIIKDRFINNMSYLFDFLRLFVYLPFLSPGIILISLPGILAALMAKDTIYSLISSFNLPIFFISAVYSLKKIKNWVSNFKGNEKLLITSLILLLITAGLLNSFKVVKKVETKLRPSFSRALNHKCPISEEKYGEKYEALNSISTLIPENETIGVDISISTSFFGDRKVRFRDPEEVDFRKFIRNIDYVLVNEGLIRCFLEEDNNLDEKDQFGEKVANFEIEKFYESDEWEVIAKNEGITLFKRKK